jgi:hypothetical protein
VHAVLPLRVGRLCFSTFGAMRGGRESAILQRLLIIGFWRRFVGLSEIGNGCSEMNARLFRWGWDDLSVSKKRDKARLGDVGGRSGFLHCTVHGETVNSFGRNDGFFRESRKERTTSAATALRREEAMARRKSNGFVVGLAAEFPPIAKSAMDGAPERLWAGLRIWGYWAVTVRLRVTVWVS